MDRPSPSRSLLAGWMALALAMLALTGLFVVALNIVQTAAKKSCAIQARGLKAAPYLVGSLDDIHQLLTLPQTPASKRQQAALPAKERATLRRVIPDLNRNLATYVRIERRQPQSRSC